MADGRAVAGDEALVCTEHGLVRLQRSIRGVSTNRLWEALTTPDGLGAWLGRVEGEDLGPGRSFAVWHDEHTRSQHRITHWIPVRALGFTWEFPSEPPSEVSFTLHQTAVGCVARVQHQGLGEPVEYAAGWHRHLDFLAAASAGEDLSGMDFWHGHPARVEHAEHAASRACGGRCARAS